MKFITAFLLALLIVVHPPHASAQLSNTSPYNQSGNFSMVFEDNFATTSINTTLWANGYFWGSSDSNMGNASLTNSYADGQYLHLKESGDTSSFTVGALTTRPSFTEGYFEARMKLASGNGYWPAFWALYENSSLTREIDVMEYLGNLPTAFYGTVKANSSELAQKHLTNLTDLSQSFHVYAGEITPTSVILYFDGVEFLRLNRSDYYGYPFRLTVNQGIMCKGVLWDNNKCDASTFNPPKETLVDYVRVWKRSTTTVPSPTPSPTPNVSSTPAPSPMPSPSPIPSPIASPLTKLGDANNDRLVNELDYSIWLKSFLSNPSLTGVTNGDFNTSGGVDGSDYILWVTNYGT